MNTSEKRWRPAEDDIQDDNGAGGESIPEWHRYILAIEHAKIRNEIAPSFEQWVAREQSEKAEPVV